MSNETRIGGVTVRINDDGTLYLYQPDSSRLMSAELAEKLADWLNVQVLRQHGLEFNERSEVVPIQSTVPSGVIMTSEGVVEIPPAEPKRRPGRPRKVQG